MRGSSSSAALHANLISIAGIGILLVGPPGSGKSALSYFAVLNGHKLIADDMVRCYVRSHALYGMVDNPQYYGWLYERSRGMIDIRWQYGRQRVEKTVRIGLTVTLGEDRQAEGDYALFDRVMPGCRYPCYGLPDAQPDLQLQQLRELVRKQGE